MSHFSMTVVIRNATDALDAQSKLNDLLDPFDEDKEMPERVCWLDQNDVDRASAWYRESPEFCKDYEGFEPFDEYVTEGNLEAWNKWTQMAVGAYHGNGSESGVYDEIQGFGYLTTWNEEGRWDWWVLGGRWNGSHQLKPGVRVGSEPLPEWRKALIEQGMGASVFDGRVEGAQSIQTVDETCVAILGNAGTGGNDPGENFEGRADLARKGDIDFAGRRALAALAAEEAYDKFEAVTKDIEIAPRWQEHVTLALVEANLDPETANHQTEGYKEALAAARDSFNNHPWMKALRGADLAGWFGDVHEHWCVNEGGRERFVEEARLNAGRTWGLLLDGEWLEKGKMGWFGMSHDEKDETLWAREFWRRIEALPDDVYLAVVDCHV